MSREETSAERSICKATTNSLNTILYRQVRREQLWKQTHIHNWKGLNLDQVEGEHNLTSFHSFYRHLPVKLRSLGTPTSTFSITCSFMLLAMVQSLISGTWPVCLATKWTWTLSSHSHLHTSKTRQTQLFATPAPLATTSCTFKVTYGACRRTGNRRESQIDRPSWTW